MSFEMYCYIGVGVLIFALIFSGLCHKQVIKFVYGDSLASLPTLSIADIVKIYYGVLTNMNIVGAAAYLLLIVIGLVLTILLWPFYLIGLPLSLIFGRAISKKIGYRE